MNSITKKDMISSPLGKATMICVRDLATAIRSKKSMSPTQLADFLEGQSGTIAMAIYEETCKQMAVEQEISGFLGR